MSHRTTIRRETIIRAPSFARLGLLSDLAKLAQYKDLLYTLSVHRIKVRYKQTLLGIAWAVLQPLSMMLVFTVIFSFVTKMPTEGAPYTVFVYAALLAWSFFSTSLTNATNGLVSHSQLVTKIYFPREILPLTYVVAALFDFLLASGVLAGLMLYYRMPLTRNALYAAPILLVLVLFAITMALFLSVLQVRFRDVGVAMPLLLQLWMFATPVIYPLSAVPAYLHRFYQLNPMVGVIENFRRVILYGAPPDWHLLGAAMLFTLILLPASYIYFKHVEATIADII